MTEPTPRQQRILDAIEEVKQILRPEWRAPDEPQFVSGDYIERVHLPAKEVAMRAVYDRLCRDLGEDELNEVDLLREVRDFIRKPYQKPQV